MGIITHVVNPCVVPYFMTHKRMTIEPSNQIYQTIHILLTTSYTTILIPNTFTYYEPPLRIPNTL